MVMVICMAKLLHNTELCVYYEDNMVQSKLHDHIFTKECSVADELAVT